MTNMLTKRTGHETIVCLELWKRNLGILQSLLCVIKHQIWIETCWSRKLFSLALLFAWEPFSTYICYHTGDIDFYKTALLSVWWELYCLGNVETIPTNVWEPLDGFQIFLLSLCMAPWIHWTSIPMQNVMYLKEAKSVQTFLLTIMKGFCCVIDLHTQYTHLPFRESVHCQTLCNMIKY